MHKTVMLKKVKTIS